MTEKAYSPEEFRERVQSARERWESWLSSGVYPEGLSEEVASLKKEEQALLTAAVPVYRRKVLDTRSPGTKLTALVKGPGEDNPDREAQTEINLKESGLSEAEEMLCRKLLNEDAPEDPSVPSGSGFDPEKYPCSFYLGCGNGQTYFLFGDDGSVLLFENNNGWQCRRNPVLTDCFAQNAVMESARSALILNLDGGIDRISYARIETAEDLLRAELYEDTAQGTT